MRRREADTLPGLWRELAGSTADAPALIHGGSAVSFGGLEARAARVAGGLRELAGAPPEVRERFRWVPIGEPIEL